MNRLQTLLANKHTSGAAAIYALASVVGHIAWTWFPSYTHQIESTVGYVKEACFIWMGVAATDASQLGQVKRDLQDVKSGTEEFRASGNGTNETTK